MNETNTSNNNSRWWKSGGDYPTIKEVVEDLRSRGELDENAYRLFREHSRVFLYYIPAFFILGGMFQISGNKITTTLGLGSEFWGCLGIILGIYLFKKAPNLITREVMLYTYGIPTEGYIVNIKKLPSITKKHGFSIETDFEDKNTGIHIREKIPFSKMYGEIDHIKLLDSDLTNITDHYRSLINKKVLVLYDLNLPKPNFFDSLFFKYPNSTIYCSERAHYYCLANKPRGEYGI